MRLINWTVAARLKYPGCRIFAKKDVFKSAYYWCHLNWETAMKTVTQIPSLELAFMNLWLTFSGKPCPYKLCVISAVICNLTTAILHNNAWDPSCLHRQNHHLVPPPIVLDNSILLGIGRELIVDIPVNPRGTNDIYIDDLISLTVGNWRDGQFSTMQPCTTAGNRHLRAATTSTHTNSSRGNGGMQ